MDISKLFLVLGRVHKFQVEVTSANEEPAKGSGSVDIERPDKESVIWRETGRWNQRYNSLEFTNCYKWSLLKSDRLGLAHLRYGDEKPVHLAELIPNNKENWCSIAPHLCGSDSYLLTLSPHSSGLMLKWRINGPHKDQISRICYI